MVDVFHTLFGIAGEFHCRMKELCGTESSPSPPCCLLNGVVGLSILGYPGLVDLDPVYCMPAILIKNKGLRKDWQAVDRRQL